MRTGLILAAVLPALFIMGCKKTSDETTTKAPAADAATADAPTTKTPTANAPATEAVTTVAATTQTVEAGCATCIYEMKDVTGCKLAVKIDGKTYLVSGKTMDDLGDAHADDGLCSIARKAEVTGKLDGDRFVVTKMALLPK